MYPLGTVQQGTRISHLYDRHQQNRIAATANQPSSIQLNPPLPLPSYQVKLRWHARFNLDAGNIWRRKTMASLLLTKIKRNR
jgi:hypothetical protein